MDAPICGFFLSLVLHHRHLSWPNTDACTKVQRHVKGSEKGEVSTRSLVQVLLRTTSPWPKAQKHAPSIPIPATRASGSATPEEEEGVACKDTMKAGRQTMGVGVGGRQRMGGRRYRPAQQRRQSRQPLDPSLRKRCGQDLRH
jgi:hypothetical protein